MFSLYSYFQFCSMPSPISHIENVWGCYLHTMQPLHCFLFIYDYREGYQQYLRRPDLKQESVSQWQKDFNSIPDDMREDEETKMELHLRLDVMRNLHMILQLS